MNQERNFSFINTAAQERTILKNVYLWMTAGLFLTAVTAWGVAGNTALLRFFLGNPIMMFGVIIAEFALVFLISRNIMNYRAQTGVLLFGIYSILNGITLSTIFMVYRLGDISEAFMVTAGTFAVMSLFGIFTKRDLSGLGHYLFMGIIGLVIAGVVNMFLHSSLLYNIYNYIGIILFTLLTAYDTQKIKNMSRQYSGSVDEASFLKFSILGALRLYLDFINLFLFILRFTARRD